MSILQGYGVKTAGDLLKKTEGELSIMRDKKGICFAAKFSQVQNKVKRSYDRLFGEVKLNESEESQTNQ